MSEEVATYYAYKMALSIPFDMKEVDFKYEDHYFDLTIMEYLKDIISEFTKKDLFSKKVKDNIKNYLLKARDFKDDKRKERIDIINDILSLLNNQQKDYSIGFYSLQLCLRRNSKKYLFTKNEEIISEIENVHGSIVNDYLVLGTHFETMSEENFKKYFLDKFIMSGFYVESINVLLDEMPQLFNNSTFYNRVMDILEMKKFFENDKQDKLSKKVDKKIKRIKRNMQV